MINYPDIPGQGWCRCKGGMGRKVTLRCARLGMDALGLKRPYTLLGQRLLTPVSALRQGGGAISADDGVTGFVTQLLPGAIAMRLASNAASV